MSPVVGVTPMTTAAFTTAGTATSDVMPKATSRGNGSRARRAMRRPAITSAAKQPRMSSTPNSPSSSATTDRMKSVCASGR